MLQVSLAISCKKTSQEELGDRWKTEVGVISTAEAETMEITDATSCPALKLVIACSIRLDCYYSISNSGFEDNGWSAIEIHRGYEFSAMQAQSDVCEGMLLQCSSG